MQAIVTPDIQSEFNSLNGGIYMRLHEFADVLVDVGVDGFFQQFQGERETEDKRLQTHLHFLKKGLKTIDETAIENAIVESKDLWEERKELSNLYSQTIESLEKGKGHWCVTMERAKPELKAWEKWANETEVKQYKESSLYRGLGVIRKLVFGSYWMSDLLSSPEKLQNNISAFEQQINAIQSLISNAYIAEELPTELDYSSLDRAIDNVVESQEKVKALSNEEKRIDEKWKSVNESYASKRTPLYKLLDQMPDSARWALFRIYREYLTVNVQHSALPQSA